MNVSNRKCIRHLSIKSMWAARSRNLIAVLAIALTTLLFTSLFTIALSINHSIQQANFRQAGSYGQGTFKYLTWEQTQELRDDPLIKEYSLRLFVGRPTQAPFHKAHVEVGYSDANDVKWMFLAPVEGRVPQEGTNEAATDTRVLALLGIEPKLGESFSLTFDVDDVETTQTFTLCGWWEYDEAVMASHVLLPHSRAQAIFDELGTKGKDGMTSFWTLSTMFSSALHIERDVEAVLEHHGYQGIDGGAENYMATGVNWGYTGAQVVQNVDPITFIAIVGLLLVIVFTGYLIIYNVFQISVAGDIRFFGLLKTIGTTGRQLRRMIRLQALALSCAGIPLGLLVGYFVGVQLTPVILSRLNGVVVDAVSTSPLIFLFATLFSLVTVLISCHRPGKMAARVSPIEAVRYNEGSGGGRALRRAKTGASLPKMAWANLGRNRRKTVLTLVSLSLAVVLLNLTVTFTNGFDMNKFLRKSVTDFVVADASYFQVGIQTRDAVEEGVIQAVEGQGGISAAGRTYGTNSIVKEFVAEDYFRTFHGRWNPPETLDALVNSREMLNGQLADTAMLYGMEPFVLDNLTVLEGDLSKLYVPGGKYVAAVFTTDDYEQPHMDSHWAKVGDQVALRYVEELEYYHPETGEVYDAWPEDGRAYASRSKTYRDVEYEVAALVVLPHSLSYRHYGSNQFILNDQTFIEDTGTSSILYYAFDTTQEGNAPMEAFLADLTEHQMPQYDYESKQSYAEEFESFRGMFIMLGGALCFIIGIVGILNFLNAILSGILARRREFAVLQAVGMTGRQLKTMLVFEGLYYTLGSLLFSLLLCIVTSPLLSPALSSMFWFFTYRFTLWPVLALIPIFALLGVLLPLASYHCVARRSIVERLREVES